MSIINVIRFILASQILENQQNLKYFSITAIQVSDIVFQVISRNCKNLEVLEVAFGQQVHFRNNNESPTCQSNEFLHLKHVTIKQLNTDLNTDIYFFNNLIQSCKGLISLNLEGKSFQFVTYIYI